MWSLFLHSVYLLSSHCMFKSNVWPSHFCTFSDVQWLKKVSQCLCIFMYLLQCESGHGNMTKL